MTAKAAKVSSRSSDDLSPADDTHEAVAWKPDVYEGAELLSHLGEHRPGVSLQDDEDQRVRLVGGSFVCRVESEEQRQALFELLELGLYVGMSMLLESSFLTDSDAARPKPSRSQRAPPRPSSRLRGVPAWLLPLCALVRPLKPRSTAASDRFLVAAAARASRINQI